MSTACLMHPSRVVYGLLRAAVRAAVERDDALCALPEVQRDARVRELCEGLLRGDVVSAADRYPAALMPLLFLLQVAAARRPRARERCLFAPRAMCEPPCSTPRGALLCQFARIHMLLTA